MQLKASAPGSLMLLGEYGVLYGKPAMVCAVDKRIHVFLSPRTDTRVEINSDLYGAFSTDLTEIEIVKPYHFVLAVLKQYQSRLKRGFNIEVKADFSDQVGLGSSAAVTVATLAALMGAMKVKMTSLDLIRQGRHIVRTVQGIGSGADIAASVHGGIVGYQGQPLSTEKFSLTHPLVVLYCGFKTKTVDAIKKVQNHFAFYPNVYAHLQSAIGQCTQAGMQAVRKGDWERLGEIMNIQQGLMEALGVSLPILHELIMMLRGMPEIKGAKISGSGLGDCVIGLGKLPAAYHFSDKVELIPVTMTTQGVVCEKI